MARAWDDDESSSRLSGLDFGARDRELAVLRLALVRRSPDDLARRRLALDLRVLERRGRVPGLVREPRRSVARDCARVRLDGSPPRHLDRPRPELALEGRGPSRGGSRARALQLRSRPEGSATKASARSSGSNSGRRRSMRTGRAGALIPPGRCRPSRTAGTRSSLPLFVTRGQTLLRARCDTRGGSMAWGSIMRGSSHNRHAFLAGSDPTTRPEGACLLVPSLAQRRNCTSCHEGTGASSSRARSPRGSR